MSEATLTYWVDEALKTEFTTAAKACDVITQLGGGPIELGTTSVLASKRVAHHSASAT